MGWVSITGHLVLLKSATIPEGMAWDEAGRCGLVDGWFARVLAQASDPLTVSAEMYAQAERRNFIDDLVLAKLQQLHFAPAGLCTDAEFVRRAFIDAAGILPMPEEVERFVADTSAAKRERLVDTRVAHKSEGGSFVVYSTPAGDLNLGQGSSSPRIGKPLPPRPLDGKPLPLGSTQDRREYVARWLTAADNTLFARAVVNRVWGNFLGRGLVNPVDDLRSTNPASNDELFAAVARDFVAHGYDVKRLIRTIMTSATYQRSSQTSALNIDDDRYYSHYLIRRLPAEVILDAFSQVTGVPEKFEGYPLGTRALQLPDTRVKSYFLTAFGRPERLVTSAAERQQDPTLAQALHVINGDTLNRKLMAEGGTIDRLAAAAAGDAAVVRALYLSALSREPTPAEDAALLKALAGPEGAPAAPSNRRLAVEDVAWALLTSKEFLFNH